MLDHTGLVVSDLPRARRFYDAIAKALGLATADNSDPSFLFGRSAAEPIPYLWIGTIRPSYWAEGSRPGLNQAHIAFVASSKTQVDEFYRAALASGGRDNGAPGPREGAGVLGWHMLTARALRARNRRSRRERLGGSAQLEHRNFFWTCPH